MAFEVGHGTLEPGQSATWHFWFAAPPDAEAGDDHGAQFCMANPSHFHDGGKLLVSGQGKEYVGLDQQRDDQGRPHPGGKELYRYWVTVTNGGPVVVDYTLQGGGLV
jgi:hypothetical protein